MIDFNQETWRPIVGWEGYYEVSTRGRVRSVDRVIKVKGRGKARIYGHMVSQRRKANGYMLVDLCRRNTKQTCYVHRLVALAFIPKPEGNVQTDHINEVKTDNRVANLQWLTPKQNCNRGTRNQRIVMTRMINKRMREMEQSLGDKGVA